MRNVFVEKWSSLVTIVLVAGALLFAMIRWAWTRVVWHLFNLRWLIPPHVLGRRTNHEGSTTDSTYSTTWCSRWLIEARVWSTFRLVA